mgnify:CR=1 FL=1
MNNYLYNGYKKDRIKIKLYNIYNMKGWIKMKKYIKQIIFLAVMIPCILFENKAYATGGFVIGTSKSEINKGESFTLTISANNAYGQVNIAADNATVSPLLILMIYQ